MQVSNDLPARLAALEPILSTASEKGLWLYHILSGAWFSVSQLRDLIEQKDFENVYPAAEFVLLDPVKYGLFLEKEARKARG